MWVEWGGRTPQSEELGEAWESSPKALPEWERGRGLQLVAPGTSSEPMFSLPPGGRLSRAPGTGPAQACPSGTSCVECR